MRIPQNHLQKVKAGVHGAQAFCIFVAGCLALAVLTKSGGMSATTGYFFGLCFLSIPALVYQVMVPMWSRAWRFANAYAYAVLDILFSILWLAAFSAVAAWNNQGVEKGSKDSDNKDNNDKPSNKSGTCSSFAYGSASKCEVSKASVGFGVMICLLFVVTSAISVHAVVRYRKTGVMPDGSNNKHGPVEQLAPEDANKDPWSTNIHEPDDDDDERRPSNPFGDHNNASSNTMNAYGQMSQQDEEASHGLLNVGKLSRRHSVPGGEEEDPHPGRQLSYGSSVQMPEAPSVYDESLAPSALSPTAAYEQGMGARLSFPEGNYRADFR